MGEATEISWAHSTFNPWWGCTNVSPACDHCYAETLAKRWGYDIWGKDKPRRFFGEKHWAEPLAWERKAAESRQPWRVFCASMGDVFEDYHQADLGAAYSLDTERSRLWQLIEATPHLTWMLLTKRPENVMRMAPRRWGGDGYDSRGQPIGSALLAYDLLTDMAAAMAEPVCLECPSDRLLSPLYRCPHRWPRNVWIGATVENQRYAELRIPKLRLVPAPVRFVSCEPLLGPVKLFDWLRYSLQWVIVGGESGAHARRMDPVWVLSLIEQCEAMDVPVFVKQAGALLAKEWGCRHRSGAKIDEWPPEFRAQEFPGATLLA